MVTSIASTIDFAKKKDAAVVDDALEVVENAAGPLGECGDASGVALKEEGRRQRLRAPAPDEALVVGEHGTLNIVHDPRHRAALCDEPLLVTHQRRRVGVKEPHPPRPRRHVMMPNYPARPAQRRRGRRSSPWSTSPTTRNKNLPECFYVCRVYYLRHLANKVFAECCSKNTR